jgi:hypothetical protein
MEYSGELVIDGIIGRACADKAEREQAAAEHIRAQRARHKTAMSVWTVLHWLGAIALIAGVILFITDFSDAANFESTILTFLVLAIPFAIAGALIGGSKGGGIAERIGHAIGGAIGGGIGGDILLVVLVMVMMYILDVHDDVIFYLVYGIIAVLSMLIGFCINFGVTKKSPSLKVPIVGAVIILGAGMALTYNNQSAFGELILYFTKELAASAPAEGAYTLDVTSENDAAKIFEVRYESGETVICLIRTTGSHRAVSIAPPGEPNSFYVKDAESEEIWPLKETHPEDYEAAAGVELVFDPFKCRDFDLIEGNDTSESAWHFRNVKVLKENEAK